MIEKMVPFCISKEISLRAFNPLKEIDRLFTLKNDISTNAFLFQVVVDRETIRFTVHISYSANREPE
jgi:hypothetical protein